jgi:crotonobetainyl-CoA:carnitine CoA-transferase CaiB-like acyl-CoA transferase
VARSENAETINQHIKEWTMKYTKEEIYKKGQALSCPVSPCKTSRDLLESEQLAARGFFVELEHPILGQHKFPTLPYQFSESPWAFRYSAPLLGEHNEDVYCNDLGFDKKELEIWKKEGVI